MKYMRVLHNYDTPLEGIPENASFNATDVLKAHQGNVLLLYCAESSGWADGVSLNSMKRGWIPTNHCEPYEYRFTHQFFRTLTTVWTGISDHCFDWDGEARQYIEDLTAGVRHVMVSIKLSLPTLSHADSVPRPKQTACAAAVPSSRPFPSSASSARHSSADSLSCSIMLKMCHGVLSNRTTLRHGLSTTTATSTRSRRSPSSSHSSLTPGQQRLTCLLHGGPAVPCALRQTWTVLTNIPPSARQRSALQLRISRSVNWSQRTRTRMGC